jgi:hypothetical protein
MNLVHPPAQVDDKSPNRRSQIQMDGFGVYQEQLDAFEVCGDLSGETI